MFLSAWWMQSQHSLTLHRASCLFWPPRTPEGKYLAVQPLNAPLRSPTSHRRCLSESNADENVESEVQRWVMGSKTKTTSEGEHNRAALRWFISFIRPALKGKTMFALNCFEHKFWADWTDFWQNKLWITACFHQLPLCKCIQRDVTVNQAPATLIYRGISLLLPTYHSVFLCYELIPLSSSRVPLGVFYQPPWWQIVN